MKWYVPAWNFGLGVTMSDASRCVGVGQVQGWLCSTTCSIRHSTVLSTRCCLLSGPCAH